jgi:hypothetical protein
MLAAFDECLAQLNWLGKYNDDIANMREKPVHVTGFHGFLIIDARRGSSANGTGGLAPVPTRYLHCAVRSAVQDALREYRRRRREPTAHI